MPSGPRLLVHVEGSTEETFINELLCPHLMSCGYDSVAARLIGNARRRDRRGGIIKWPRARTDILRHLGADRELIVSTMVDYYAMPDAVDRGGWPGRSEASKLVGTSGERAELIETAMLDDVAEHMGKHFERSRFDPYVAMHEFEAMLFSDCKVLCESLGLPSLEAPLLRIGEAFPTPEDIDDSPQTAPSKRLTALMEQRDVRYDKVLHGFVALDDIGLPKIRSQCPHFDTWLRRLEGHATPRK